MMRNDRFLTTCQRWSTGKHFRPAVYEDGYEPQAISIVIDDRDNQHAGNGLLGEKANSCTPSHAAARFASHATNSAGGISYRRTGCNANRHPHHRERGFFRPVNRPHNRNREIDLYECLFHRWGGATFDHP